MNRLRQFLVVFFATFMSTSSFAERTVGPIGPGKPSASDHARAKSLGVDLNKPYVVVRKALASAGWAHDLDKASSRAYPEFPEIVCGNGMDAICWGRFIKGDKTIMLTVNQHTKTLHVVHINDD